MVPEIASVHTNGHQCAFVDFRLPSLALVVAPLRRSQRIHLKNVCIGALLAHEMWYFPFTLATRVAIRQSTPDEML